MGEWPCGKSTSSIGTVHASMEHGAKTDSDLARPPGGEHPAMQQASPGDLTRSAARCGRSAARHAHSNPSDSKHGPRMQLSGRLGDRGGAGRQRSGPSRRRTGAGGPGVDPGRRRPSRVLEKGSSCYIFEFLPHCGTKSNPNTWCVCPSPPSHDA